MRIVQSLAPDVAAVMDAFGDLEFSEATLPLFRSRMPVREPSPGMVRTTVEVPGDPSVLLRVSRADGAAGGRPCVFSMHGGGYVIGDSTMDDERFEQWCLRLGVVGVSVQYRLAPEHPYPAALEDCYRGLRWVYDNSELLGLDRTRIGVAGVSAGGGLAAALALLARDRAEVPIAYVLMEAPMLDDRQQTTSSQASDLSVWSRDSNGFGWRSYLGELYGTVHVPYTAAAARCDDLSGLPPSFVSVGTVDGFRDEDIDFALRLNQAGVPCELHVYPGACHGYQLAADSAVARQSERDVTDWLTRQLEAGATTDDHA